ADELAVYAVEVRDGTERQRGSWRDAGRRRARRGSGRGGRRGGDGDRLGGRRRRPLLRGDDAGRGGQLHRGDRGGAGRDRDLRLEGHRLLVRHRADRAAGGPFALGAAAGEGGLLARRLGGQGDGHVGRRTIVLGRDPYDVGRLLAPADAGLHALHAHAQPGLGGRAGRARA